MMKETLEEKQMASFDGASILAPSSDQTLERNSPAQSCSQFYPTFAVLS